MHLAYLLLRDWVLVDLFDPACSMRAEHETCVLKLLHKTMCFKCAECGVCTNYNMYNLQEYLGGCCAQALSCARFASHLPGRGA